MIVKATNWLFRRLTRRSSNAPTSNSMPPHDALEALERWSARATLLILLGIVIDAFVTIWFSRSEDSAYEMPSRLAANALIGLGLIVEYICILSAIIQTRRERQESDERVAAAEERASEANARSSEAAQKAAEAQLELARFRAGREMTKKQRDDAAEHLKPYAGTQYDFAAHSNDPEIMLCILHIYTVLEAAGWVAMPWVNPSAEVIKGWPSMPPIGLGISVLGVMIGIKIKFVGPATERRIVSELIPAAGALARELSAIPGMEGTTVAPYMLEVNPEASKNEHAIHILVGRKT
jgi:hypothetical protein